MSKTKRARPVGKTTKREHPSLNMDTITIDKETLAMVQVNHLTFLETNLSSLPRFYGTPVAVAMTYEILQIMNNYFLSGALK